MSHSFTIKINDDIHAVLKKVESSIIGNGGTFEGTHERGIFHGKSVAGLIKGEYCSVAGNEIKITITDKPFIVPHSMIEAEIRNYFI
jgi:hypothetical protein